LDVGVFVIFWAKDGGLYWHSEYSSNKDRFYHLKKHELTEDKGYRLITVFSDEWLLKSNQTKNVLAHILGKTSDRIGARETDISIIDKKNEKSFFEEYHLQGYVPSDVCVGLKYNDEIIAAMSFGKNRKGLNRFDEQGVYEIRRMAFSKNIPGGANKMFSYFIKMYLPKEVWSDCDRRWSSGKIYTSLGMNEFAKSKPNYWYVSGYINRHHRLNFTKKRLVNQGHDAFKTEEEIMRDLGYDRIWDCGIIRFVWKSNV
jgi:hypothetical protein